MLGLSSPEPAKPQPRPQVRPQPKKQQKKAGKGSRKVAQRTDEQVWVEGLTDDGYTYYYNTITGGEESCRVIKVCIACIHFIFKVSFIIAFVYLYMTESKWDKPEGFQGESSASAQTQQTGVNIYFLNI